MRDRLGHIQVVLNEHVGAASASDSEGFTTLELDDLSEQQTVAAASDHDDQDLNGVLQEAQHIRLDVCFYKQIQYDISELGDINHQALNNASHPTDMMKWDSNTIGADIKRRGEAVLQQLHRMNSLSKELKLQRGSADPVVRIARAQYQCLSNAFWEVMFNYNDTEMGHREACKRQIQRQMEVVGRDITEEDLEVMMESCQLNVFSLQVEGKMARSALTQIESWHKELLDLEKRVQGIQELFLDVAVLIEEQEADTDNIQINVQKTEASIQDVMVHLEKATT